MADDLEFRQRMKRIEDLVHTVQTVADPAVRARATELVELLLELHGTGLERIVEIVGQTASGGAIVENFTREPLVASLLLLYNLHPHDLPTRVGQALEKVRPYLRSHGGNVELLSIDESRVHLRLVGSCHGCLSSALTLKTAIEEALHQFAPDAEELVVEGVVAEPVGPTSAFVPLADLRTAEAATPANSLP